MPRGRKLGGKNKPIVSPVTLDLIETLKNKNFEPAAKMVELHAEAMAMYHHKCKTQKGWGAGPALDTAARAIDSLMRYTYPTRKAVEVSGPDGKPIEMSWSQLALKALDAETKK